MAHGTGPRPLDRPAQTPGGAGGRFDDLTDLTDRTVLTTREYATPDRLDARAALYRYQQPPYDIVGSAVRLLHDAPGPLLDVGCGPGRYLSALRADRPDRPAFAADLSIGMLLAAGRPGIVADAAALPVPDGACGAVLAMHMLYHVPEPEAAVAELARVRAPGGTVLVGTNAEDDKQVARNLHAEVVRELTGGPVLRHVSRRFTLDDGERMVRRHFRDVERVDVRTTLVLPDPGPVLRWLDSMSGPDVTPEILDAVRARVAAVIAREGAFRVGTHIGFLVCR